MKITRRKLAAGALVSAAALAQNRQTAAPESDADLLNAAREQNRSTGELLSRYKIPMATEPAFQFKP
jgi:hypothetical protein